MALLLPIAVGIGVGLLRGGSFRHLAALPVRLVWLAPFCLVAQLVVAYYPLDRIETERQLQAGLLVGSSLLLMVVLWANRRMAGAAIIATGLLLNVAVMVANGGFMPVSGQSIVDAKIRPLDQLPEEGGRLPRSKDIVLRVERTRLWFLSDVFVAPGLPAMPAKAYSIGDVIVALGAFALFYSAMSPRGRNRFREDGGVNAL